MGLLTHTSSFNTQRRQHISVQHRGSTNWLLQLNLARWINVIDYQAATSVELVGSCGAAATETNSRGAPSAVTSLAARRTLGDLQAGRSYVQRATHGDPGVLFPSFGDRKHKHIEMKKQITTILSCRGLYSCIDDPKHWNPSSSISV